MILRPIGGPGAITPSVCVILRSLAALRPAGRIDRQEKTPLTRRPVAVLEGVAAGEKRAVRGAVPLPYLPVAGARTRSPAGLASPSPPGLRRARDIRGAVLLIESSLAFKRQRSRGHT